ncbi:MAG: hypothetical protein IT304_04775 [Dehalococcoidia bacterium]|nr:hypothetical protein [Dehalococcoidia bacterium]
MRIRFPRWLGVRRPLGAAEDWVPTAALIRLALAAGALVALVALHALA